MRQIDPFSFFFNHASAVAGLGGDGLSPDPRYCFHTPYVLVRPGAASFELTLRDVRATRGELALRVHAFRPESGENASLVAASRLDVSTAQRVDLTATVRFAALRDVHYAFYGFFIEDSDIAARALEVALHEPEDGAVDFIPPPRSILAQHLPPREVRPANALIHVIAPHLAKPVSQDCTEAQIAEAATGVEGVAMTGDWAEMLCLAALGTYGIRDRALEALLVGPVSQAFATALGDAGFLLRQADTDDVPAPSSPVFADVVFWPQGLGHEPDPETRWSIVQAWLARLKIGGLGVITMRYRPEVEPVSCLDVTDGPDLTRNAIGKWALKLIGLGYDVAPLAFSLREDLRLDADGLARFALIVRRH